MNPRIDVRAFEGEAYTIRKYNIRKNTVFAFPKGSFILASDLVIDEDENTSVAEVWLALPLTAEVAEGHPVRKSTAAMTEEPWTGSPESVTNEDDEITVDLFDGDEDSEDE